MQMAMVKVNILNMKEYHEDDERNLYLTACLLSFYQQQHLFKKSGKTCKFNIEKPLWYLSEIKSMMKKIQIF